MAWAADATFQFKNFKVIAVGRDDGLADKAGGSSTARRGASTSP
jgi:hypothetical protein